MVAFRSLQMPAVTAFPIAPSALTRASLNRHRASFSVGHNSLSAHGLAIVRRPRLPAVGVGSVSAHPRRSGHNRVLAAGLMPARKAAGTISANHPRLAPVRPLRPITITGPPRRRVTAHRRRHVTAHPRRPATALLLTRRRPPLAATAAAVTQVGALVIPAAAVVVATTGASLTSSSLKADPAC